MGCQLGTETVYCEECNNTHEHAVWRCKKTGQEIHPRYGMERREERMAGLRSWSGYFKWRKALANNSKPFPQALQISKEFTLGEYAIGLIGKAIVTRLDVDQGGWIAHFEGTGELALTI